MTTSDKVMEPRKEPSVDQYRARPAASPLRCARIRLVRIGTVCPSSQASGQRMAPMNSR
jgi:hypothetical protein